MCNGRPPAMHAGAPESYSSIPGGSGRTRLLAADLPPMRLPVLVLLVWATGVCGAGRADGLASVLSKGHEPESGRALAPPGHRAVSRIARPQPAPSLRPVDGARAPTGPSSWWGFGSSRPAGSGSSDPSSASLATLGLVMPARWFPRYVAGLCAVGVLLWAQGNLLLADYGLLDGGGLDLASHAWRTPFESRLVGRRAHARRCIR